jgi:hypothetical protein
MNWNVWFRPDTEPALAALAGPLPAEADGVDGAPMAPSAPIWSFSSTHLKRSRPPHHGNSRGDKDCSEGEHMDRAG